MYSLAAPKAAAVSARAVRAGPIIARASQPSRGSLVLRRAEEEASPNATVSASCSIDDPSSCSLADLEMMYIDALWNYYNDGKFTISDEQYDRLREELNWCGSASE